MTPPERTVSRPTRGAARRSTHRRSIVSLLLALVAALSLGATPLSAQSAPGAPQSGGAPPRAKSAQPPGQPLGTAQPPATAPSAAPEEPAILAISDLVDAAGANLTVLNQALVNPALLERLLGDASVAPFRGSAQAPAGAQQILAVLRLTDALDPAQVVLVRSALDHSVLLQQYAEISQDILGTNRSVVDALERDNLRVGDVVALDVVSQPPVLFVLPRGPSQPTLAVSGAQGQGQQTAGAPSAQSSVPKLVPLIIARSDGGSVLALAPVFIKGQGPFPFALDTGASQSAIDLDLVQRLGLPIADEKIDVTGVGGRTQAQLAHVQQWRVGEVELPATRAGAISLGGQNGGPGIAGLLGSDMLSLFDVVTVDYQRGVLVLHEPIERAGPQTSPPSSSSSPSAGSGASRAASSSGQQQRP